MKYVGMNLPPQFLMSANAPIREAYIWQLQIFICVPFWLMIVSHVNYYAIKGHNFLENYQ